MNTLVSFEILQSKILTFREYKPKTILLKNILSNVPEICFTTRLPKKDVFLSNLNIQLGSDTYSKSTLLKMRSSYMFTLTSKMLKYLYNELPIYSHM